ncbi:hypothetical protein DXZ75_20405 [Streptomyces sp. AcE210]|nr:hypothetical protein DXZ75_20405 [Streptomyces sp. AcE210]
MVADGAASTKVSWRAEELPGGSLRMTAGDVDVAPKDLKSVRGNAYRAPAGQAECDNVGIIRADCGTGIS